jgi:hypothetical protein
MCQTKECHTPKYCSSFNTHHLLKHKILLNQQLCILYLSGI